MNQEIDKIVLKYGSHTRREDGMCAMEAVAWLAREPHSDRPKCTCPVIAAFVRRFNDRLRNDEERTRLLRPFLPDLIGTRASKDVMTRRGYLAADWSIRALIPILFCALGWDEEADSCASLAPIIDKITAEVGRDA